MFEFGDLVYWHWWVLALVLVGVEILAPGFVFFWLGIAAGVVGLALLLFPGISWEIQLLIFAVVSIATLAGWWTYAWGRRKPADPSSLNRRNRRYVGRTFTLEMPVENGRGSIHVDDSRWSVEADRDLPAGTRVKVVDTDGTILKIEAV